MKIKNSEKQFNNFRFNILVDYAKEIEKKHNKNKILSSVIVNYSNNHIYISTLGTPGLFTIDLKDEFYLLYKIKEKIYVFLLINIAKLVKIKELNNPGEYNKYEEIEKYLNIINQNYPEEFKKLYLNNSEKNKFKKYENIFSKFVFFEKIIPEIHLNKYDYIGMQEEIDFVIVQYPDYENIKNQLNKIKKILDLKFNKIHSLPENFSAVKYLFDEELNINKDSINSFKI